ncbi:MAG: hypothetical protein IJU65_11135 [Desulfovibrio sp.]|nr:hypothetical protein [Desulfovibrio sp.]
MPEKIEILQNTMNTPWLLMQRKNGYHSVKYKKNDDIWEITPEIIRFYQDTETVHFFTFTLKKEQWIEWIFPKKKAYSHAVLHGLTSVLSDIPLPKGVLLPGKIEASLLLAQMQ